MFVNPDKELLECMSNVSKNWNKQVLHQSVQLSAQASMSDELLSENKGDN